MEYLELWVTRSGVKPMNKNVKVITNMKPPNPQIEVRKFIGVVNYYHVMWQRQSHTLAPLTKIMFNKKEILMD